MVSLGRHAPRRAARETVASPDHRRPADARARVLEERLRRPEALAYERAAHLHPGGCAAVPGGRGWRRGDRRARGRGAPSAGQPAPRGPRAGGYPRRGRVLPAARGLAQEDRRLSAEVAAQHAAPPHPSIIYVTPLTPESQPTRHVR